MDNLSKTQLVIGGVGYGLAVLVPIFSDDRFLPKLGPFLIGIMTTFLLLIVLIVPVFVRASRKLIRKQKSLPDDSESTLSASFITIIIIVVAWLIILKL